ncbi:C2H2 finger domain-containing protein [Nemania serpens]|nr:C2H2 finger domain-containing protein [Nemania serpens]
MYDSDASLSPSGHGNMFDINGDQRDNSTEATESDEDDLDLDSNCGDENFDVDNQVALYGGNVHPPEYYQQGILKPAQRDRYERYAPKSRLRIREVEAQWKQFCAHINLGNYKEGFRSASVPMVEKFLEWTICQKVGKNDRKKRGTNTSGALDTRWKLLQIVYKVAMGRKFKPHIYDGMAEVKQRLAVIYGLRTTRRRNRFMTVETLKEKIETTLSTTKKRFDLGELRILVVLFLLLLAPGGSRPESILMLRYGDIRVTLARDPDGGLHNLMVRFTPEFTKTYLGAKESTTFTVPEGIFNRSLLLSPHVFLLAILFRHKAFLAPSLTYPEGIEQLHIHPGENELPLPLRPELNDVFIFRRAIKGPTGYYISENECITYGMMRNWIVAIGVIMGIEDTVIMYSLRYLTGNKLDQSPDISESLRNLSLGHSNSVPFQRHYLSREICADTFAIVLGEAPQQALITQSCSIAHSKSKRRPTKLTPEQLAMINTDPRVKAMDRKLRGMPRGEGRTTISRNLRNLKQRMKNALWKKSQKEWANQQAVDDIERQLRGEGFARAPVHSSSPQHPAQKRMVEALTAPAEYTLEGQYRRKNRAIHALIAYCSVEEGRTLRHTGVVVAKTIKCPKKSIAGSPVDAAVLSVLVKTENERPKRCFLCIGKAMDLPPEEVREGLLHEWYSPQDLTKHFRRRHLSRMQKDNRVHCRVCGITLDHKEHFQNHARRVHGTVS